MSLFSSIGSMFSSKPPQPNEGGVPSPEQIQQLIGTITEENLKQEIKENLSALTGYMAIIDNKMSKLNEAQMALVGIKQSNNAILKAFVKTSISSKDETKYDKLYTALTSLQDAYKARFNVYSKINPTTGRTVYLPSPAEIPKENPMQARLDALVGRKQGGKRQRKTKRNYRKRSYKRKQK